MKRVSLGLLLLAAAVFIISLGHERTGVWGFVRAGAEAAMVGGLADWFAVTALFRHPLGIPIPHTAIIPRKKDDLAAALQDFLAENFLTDEIVRERINDAHVAAKIGRWIEDPAHQRRIIAEASRIGRRMLGRVSEDDVRSIVSGTIVPRLAQEPVSPLLGRLLARIVADGQHREAVDIVAAAAERWLRANPTKFTNIVGAKAPQWAPSFITDRVKQWSYQEALDWIRQVRDIPNHGARLALDDYLVRLADELQHDESMQERVENLKARLLHHPAVADAAVSVWQALARGIDGALDDETSTLVGRAEVALGNASLQLREDAAVQAKVDGLIADAASFLATTYGRELSSVISATIQKWDGKQASQKIELHVGRDLQFIRINGTVVGCLAGLAIHTVAVLLG